MDILDLSNPISWAPDGLKRPNKKPQFTLDSMSGMNFMADSNSNLSNVKPNTLAYDKPTATSMVSINTLNPVPHMSSNKNTTSQVPFMSSDEFMRTSFYDHERNKKKGLYTSEQNQQVEEIRKQEEAAREDRMWKKSESRVYNTKAYYDADPYMAAANLIRSDLNLNPIESKISLRRSRRYKIQRGSFDKAGKLIEIIDPKEYTQDFWRKENIVDWAKTHGLKLNETDTGKFRTGSKLVNTYRTRRSGKKYTGQKAVQQYEIRKPDNKTEKTVVLYDKFASSIGNKESLYKKYFNPIETTNVSSLADAEDKLKKQIASETKVRKGVMNRYQGRSQIGEVKYLANQQRLAEEQQKTANLISERDVKKNELSNIKLEYYTATDSDFEYFENYKQGMLSNIDVRNANQQFVIDSLNLDASTLDKKEDRTNYLIPTLEEVGKELDTKETNLKTKIRGHSDSGNWQKQISQKEFGTDTISGDSQVDSVLYDTGKQVRGGAYYSQDIGNLLREVRKHEASMKAEIKQKDANITNIVPDVKDDLATYYTDTQSKEYEKASKDYLSKSLEMTEEERLELEYQRRKQGFGEVGPAKRSQQYSSRGRPSLKQKSMQGNQYQNKRTRGGHNNLGGLVI